MGESDLVRRVYREFSTGPLMPERQRALYVNLDEVRGEVRGSADVVSRLEGTMRLADAPTCQVLAGHSGSGKSTELYRLKKRLESGDQPLFVVYVEADKDIDRNDVEFSDILIAIIRQMATELKDRANVSLTPGYFKDRLQRLKGILTSEIDLESFELGYGMAKLAGQIKASPDARTEIRKLLEPDTSNWLAAANDVIGKAVQELGNTGKAGLAILMDGLDKMTVREHSGSRCKTDEYLFVNRAAQLTAFACHVVYAMPLSLAYSHHQRAIRSNYGGYVPVIPMTKVANRPPNKKPYPPGVAKFREVIDRRLKEAGVNQSEVFAADQVVDELIALSGGQPTELMTLVREAIIAHALPIDTKSLERAKIEGRREYARQLRKDHWPIIKEIARDGKFVRTPEKEPAFRELLDSRAILQYVNDEEWYGVNPMVAALLPQTKPRKPKTAP